MASRTRWEADVAAADELNRIGKHPVLTRMALAAFWGLSGGSQFLVQLSVSGSRLELGSPRHPSYSFPLYEGGSSNRPKRDAAAAELVTDK